MEKYNNSGVIPPDIVDAEKKTNAENCVERIPS